jgi:hypothetical protein
MAAFFPAMLASGVTEVGRFDQFDLFAGESDIVSDRAQAADGQAIQQFEIVQYDDEGRVVPWTAAGDYPASTLTFSSNPSAEDTVTINGVVIAFETSDTVAGVDCLIGSTGADTAINLMNLINGTPQTIDSLGQPVAGTDPLAGTEVRASINSSTPTVVDITALEMGTGDNALTLAISATYPVVGAATLVDVTGTATVPSGKPMGIAAQAVAAATPGAMVPFFTAGVFNHQVLIWPAGVQTLAQRRMAFSEAGGGISVGQLL